MYSLRWYLEHCYELQITQQTYVLIKMWLFHYEGKKP